MGLFSSSGKNKQDSASEDSAYYSRAEDDSAGLARARAKRANSAGEPPGARRKEGRPAPVDPVLPEKKRARRRLVGAVALALAVAVGLPMLLDSEPKPLAGDIAIQIPSKDKPLADIAPASARAAAASATAASVAAADTLDKREEFIAPPAKAAVAAPAVAQAVATPTPAKAEVKAPPKPEPKAEAKAADAKHADKADKLDVKTVDLKHGDKLADKVTDKVAEKPVVKVVKTEDKPAAKPALDAPPDAARALAILEGKAAEPAAAAAAPAAAKVVVQVAALGSPEKVAELQTRLKDAGIKSYTEKGTNAAGEHVIRVKVGPFSKDEADKVRAKLGKIGLSGITVAG